MSKPPPRRRPRKRASLGKNRLLFWPFPLFGNPGGDAGVLALHDALHESLSEHFDEPESRLRAVAEVTELDIIEFLEPQDLVAWREQLRAQFQQIRADGDFPVVVGSNHLVALPILDAYAALKQRVCVVQLDAHLDAYELARSRERLHHGNFLLHVARPPRGGHPRNAPRRLSIVNVGHRDLTLAPAHAATHFDRAWGTLATLGRPFEETVAEIAAHVRGFDLVHLDIDADVLDPGVMRAVGTPVPCGLTGREVMAIAAAIPAGKLAGISLSEYSALLDDRDGSSRSLLVWLLQVLLLRRSESARG